MTPRACPTCGQTDEPTPGGGFCAKCAREGHMYRMMTAAELRASAARNREAGYERVAQRREQIAAAIEEVQ